MEEKIIEKGVEAVAENEQVMKKVVKLGKGKGALLMAAGGLIVLFTDKIVVPAVKKVFAKRKADDENQVIDGEAGEIED